MHFFSRQHKRLSPRSYTYHCSYCYCNDRNVGNMWTSKFKELTQKHRILLVVSACRITKVTKPLIMYWPPKYIEQGPYWRRSSYTSCLEMSLICGNHEIYIVFTTDRYCSLTWARWILYQPVGLFKITWQSMPTRFMWSHSFTSLTPKPCTNFSSPVPRVT